MPDELDKILNDLHFKGGLWNSKGELSPSTHASNDPCVEEAKAQLNALFLSQAIEVIDNCEVPIRNFVAISKYKAELRAAFQAKYGGSDD